MSGLFENPEFLRDYGLLRMERGIGLAMDAVDREDLEYNEALFQCIVSIATTQDTVHIDDVLRRFKRKPAHPNANAGAWRRAKNQRYIWPSGRRLRCTVDPIKNAHDYPVYNSLLRGSHVHSHA
jgi:hypothetical protein